VLDNREKKIISQFGLNGGSRRLWKDVAGDFGVTRERIRHSNIALPAAPRLRKKEIFDTHSGPANGKGLNDGESHTWHIHRSLC